MDDNLTLIPKPKPVSAGRELHRLQGNTMGTTYSVAFAAPPRLNESRIAREVFAAVDAVDRQMSSWKSDSDLCRFNRAELGSWVEVPEELAFVVRSGQVIARQSDGGFDMTIGQAISLWGFGPEGSRNDLPTDAEVQTALAAGGADRLQVRADRPALRKTAPLRLDLSGIAKGYGVDRIAEVLEAAGCTNYMVSLDGELRLRGRNPETRAPWTVAVETPVADRREAWDILEPPTCALATSGDYRKFRDIRGRRFAHTINPRTARPVQNAIGSVTVSRTTCLEADAWATALLVLGPVAGIALAQRRGIAALFLVRTAGRIDEIVTGNFTDLIG
jgi:thiamine biosynthesis lipoprotein